MVLVRRAAAPEGWRGLTGGRYQADVFLIPVLVQILGAIVGVRGVA